MTTLATSPRLHPPPSPSLNLLHQLQLNQLHRPPSLMTLTRCPCMFASLLLGSELDPCIISSSDLACPFFPCGPRAVLLTVPVLFMLVAQLTAASQPARIHRCLFSAVSSPPLPPRYVCIPCLTRVLSIRVISWSGPLPFCAQCQVFVF